MAYTIAEMASPISEQTADGQIALAKEFLLAAKCLLSCDQVPIRPVYWSLSHSLEMLLKAYLMAKGIDGAELKKPPINHDLVELLDRAKAKGLKISERTDEIIRGAAAAHRSFFFRYGHPELKEDEFLSSVKVPFFGELESAAQELLDATL